MTWLWSNITLTTSFEETVKKISRWVWWKWHVQTTLHNSKHVLMYTCWRSTCPTACHACAYQLLCSLYYGVSDLDQRLKKDTKPTSLWYYSTCFYMFSPFTAYLSGTRELLCTHSIVFVAKENVLSCEVCGWNVTCLYLHVYMSTQRVNWKLLFIIYIEMKGHDFLYPLQWCLTC